MNILVLMAGRGKRFLDAGYSSPKPLIMVRGKTILEWTTESCPYIKHGGDEQQINLYFAVLQEHLELGIDKFLYSVYGGNISIIPFQQVTKGNLETAYLSCLQMKNLVSPLLVLDSDNKYDGINIPTFLSKIPHGEPNMSIFVFDTQSHELPNKWSNAIVNSGRADEIREKDDAWVKYPALIGAFYFTDTSNFISNAKLILNTHSPIKGEYYMSMVPANSKNVVYACTVDKVVPLGTPLDVKNFEDNL